jgi:hypothetical protein
LLLQHQAPPSRYPRQHQQQLQLGGSKLFRLVVSSAPSFVGLALKWMLLATMLAQLRLMLIIRRASWRGLRAG